MEILCTLFVPHSTSLTWKMNSGVLRGGHKSHAGYCGIHPEQSPETLRNVLVQTRRIIPQAGDPSDWQFVKSRFAGVNEGECSGGSVWFRVKTSAPKFSPKCSCQKLEVYLFPVPRIFVCFQLKKRFTSSAPSRGASH